MKGSRTWMMLCGVVAVLVAALTAEGASIRRVKCRVQPDKPQVQIAIDVRDLMPDDEVTARVSNLMTGAGPVVSVGVATADAEGDAEHEFDSDIDPADSPEGTRSPIDGAFAAVNHEVKGTAFVGGIAVAMGTATCVEK